MALKEFIGASVATHAVLGNLCMMTMTGMTMPPMTVPHAEHADMAMSQSLPMSQTPSSDAPMSPAHCPSCLKMQAEATDSSQGTPSCAGHCLSQAQSTVMSTTSFDALPFAAGAPIAVAIVQDADAVTVFTPPGRAPPVALHIETIVLRL